MPCLVRRWDAMSCQRGARLSAFGGSFHVLRRHTRCHTQTTRSRSAAWRTACFGARRTQPAARLSHRWTARSLQCRVSPRLTDPRPRPGSAARKRHASASARAAGAHAADCMCARIACASSVAARQPLSAAGAKRRRRAVLEDRSRSRRGAATRAAARQPQRVTYMPVRAVS